MNGLSNDEYDRAMKCFDVVIERASILISIKQNCEVERRLLRNVLTNKGRLLLERKRNFSGAASCLGRARAIGELLQDRNVMNDFHLALALSNLSIDDQKEALKICLYSIDYIQQNKKDGEDLSVYFVMNKLNDCYSIFQRDQPPNY